MQLPESWLREFCDPPIATAALCDLLTMGGMEVEEARPVAPPFTGVVVGQVLEVARHPNADRLSVCQVDVGRGAPLRIVCGAPNVRAGIKVPCALVGAELPAAEEGDGKPFVIKVGQLRGVESQGMLCSARELAPLRRPRRPADPGRVGGDRSRRARGAAPRRHADHAEAHAEPRPLPERLRHRARALGAVGSAAARRRRFRRSR